MYAVAAQLIIFSTIGCAFPRANGPDDIIWYPIDDFSNGYISSQGEYFAGQASDHWSGDKSGNIVGLPKSRRFFRSLPANRRNNKFDADIRDNDFEPRPGDFWDLQEDIKRAVSADEPVVFPGETNARQLQGDDCKESCPFSSEYNPVCGTDFQNYPNPGALKCEQYCGKSVRFAHYGVCGSGLPGIFKPKPRATGSATARTSNNVANTARDDRTGRRFEHL